MCVIEGQYEMVPIDSLDKYACLRILSFIIHMVYIKSTQYGQIQ